jgi:protocatechuate 4,5-dioxygenase, alpha chain
LHGFLPDCAFAAADKPMPRSRPAATGTGRTMPAFADTMRAVRTLPDFDLSLDPPSTFIFTGEICSRCYALNRFAFAFKDPAHRQRFNDNPDALMDEFELSEAEKALVHSRDWTGLVASGGHHFNIIKIAAAVGESHLHVGAHMCGQDWGELKQSLPHVVSMLPEDLA